MTFARRLFAIALLCLVTGAGAARAQNAGAIAPIGALRVAVAVGPAASAFWTVRDATTGRPVGVTVELGKAAAAKLNVPLELVEFRNSDEIAAAASKDAWDISFTPADAKRAQLVDQGPAYVEYLSGYLVRNAAGIHSLADVDRPGVNVGCIEGTSTSRTVESTVKKARVTKFAKPEAAAELLGKGELDALAMGMGALEDLSRKMKDVTILKEIVQRTDVVVVTPKGKDRVRDWAALFLDSAKKDGSVCRALDVSGFRDEKVAP